MELRRMHSSASTMQLSWYVRYSPKVHNFFHAPLPTHYHLFDWANNVGFATYVF
uniref:Uncharacterized protein n=1 Tax=Anguilla anguilla TaxID=7936 RepID=A0A0E9VW22_ANGAN